MKVVTKTGSPESFATEGFVAGVFADEEPDSSVLKMDKEMGGHLLAAIENEKFRGEPGQLLLINTLGVVPAGRVALVGLGEKDKADEESFRRAMAVGALSMRKAGATRITTSLPTAFGDKDSYELLAQAVTEGAILATYRFERLKSEKSKTGINTLTLLAPDNKSRKELTKGVLRGTAVSEATTFARDLINLPGNYATPTILGAEAKKIAKQYGAKCTVFGPAEIAKKKMGGLMAVAQGSKEPARFIILEWMKGPKNQQPVVLVGKGLTFDTGGISIKPSANMEEMKSDMSGGAAVMGVMKAVAELKMKINLVCLVPSTENMPGSAAVKPGDVAIGLSGVSMEIINTDAEGRLILSDALAYAGNYKPDCVVDVATLTGACMIALGRHASGLFSNDDVLADQLSESGLETGELLWPLPLLPEHDEDIASLVADIKNVGPRWGGASTAAAFLQKHVKGKWAHLDIAGTAFSDKNKHYTRRGGVGVGVRSLVRFLEKRMGV